MPDEILSCEIDPKIKVTETIDYGIPGVENEDAVLEIADLATSLSPSSSTPVTKAWKHQGALVAAAATIDLTTLVRTNLPDIDLSSGSLKVQGFIFRNNSEAGSLTIKDGAANSYELFGDADGQVTLPAGTADHKAFVFIFAPEGLDDVAAGDAEIDLSSAGDATLSYDVIIVAG